MKTAITTILTLILTISVYGNDGVYLTRGGVIYPTKESKISLDREVLSFSVQDKICRVDILFEFNNPENVERKLMIGFQAPTAVGDVSENSSNTNQIADFIILANGQILPYQLKAAECEDCELKEPKDFQFSQFEQGVFVYLFELTFKPGLNKINHSYSFPASSNVEFDQFYNYILTTGAKWAGGTIKNLTINFDLGSNKYFYVNDIFGENANWSIIGSGKVTGKKFDNNEDNGRMVRILSGRLQIEVSNFKPEKNIEFGIICENSFITRPTDLEKLKEGKVFGICSLSLEKEIKYSKETLKILRNTVYAQYCYSFNSKDLKDYFAQFEWYIPDPNLTMEQIKMTEEEKKFIDEIVIQEKE
ncbi:hypothetical protein GCM10011343_27790 [Flavobacterium orientale]|uniref:YARHG domain-containing protein n=2 Tax=Flavobacterium orientale TaxID=1756020 RepID=A0A917DGI3_9FLAO|nr:hypothetical protein GCM10011343_27790 [Flavobacterium orientale]